MTFPPPDEPLAGWFGVFADLPGYQRTFRAPEIAPAGIDLIYSQAADYEWTGGAIKSLRVTLARGRWPAATGQPEAAAPAHRRHEVPLAADKALILDAFGEGPWEDLAELAGAFDPGRIEAALDAPPRDVFRRTPDVFRRLEIGAALLDVLAWLGPADRIASEADPLRLEYDLQGDRQAVLKFTLGEVPRLAVANLGSPEDLEGDDDSPR